MPALRPVLLIIIPLVFIFSCAPDRVETAHIEEGWAFKQAGTSEWLPARVPASVHLNLMDHQMIQDPFFGDNEQSLQWIGESDWEFKTSFSGSDLLDKKKAELVFDGLDTYADVYLNDSCILKADNMFRRWVLDVKPHLKEGMNHLYIRFFSPARIEKDKQLIQGYPLPEERGFTRKAPYQYGWDWGPSFITSGIWQPVFLRYWNEIRISDVQTRLVELTPHEAVYRSLIEIDASGYYTAVVTTRFKAGDIPEKSKVFQLKEGTNTVELNFTIPDPQLWWPNGMGDPFLYDLEFVVETRNARDLHKTSLGVRTVELVTRADSIGESFYFKINDRPVFMKGANYIPQDNFLARVSDEKYRQTLQAAVNANMNMIRVWGGGVYEKDIFYDLCDELGLLVWQDFMFACNLYPGDSLFLENVRQEAVQQVKRLRRHPSLALWCGNNEVSEGWFNWGWQKSLGYSKTDSLDAWNNYLQLFETLLPEVVLACDSGRAYWPSSPGIGWGHESAMYSGDMHYWGVWWGEEPFGIFEKKVGRFMSEFGFQGFPPINTLDSCLSTSDLTLESDKLMNHQKHPRGMELIRTYMEREFPVPEKFDEYAYVSQLLQAYGIKTALDAHRRAKPRCMGTLYWQLNDCWPVISWSSLDYYNQWKALHYFTRDVYKNVAMSLVEEEGQVNVYVISDLWEQKEARLDLVLMDFHGTNLWEKTVPVLLEENSSAVCFAMDKELLLAGRDPSGILLHATLNEKNDGTEVADGIHYFVPPKDLVLPEPTMLLTGKRLENGYEIEITDSKLVKNVYLKLDVPGHFSTNFFDLLPGDTIKLDFKARDTFHGKLPPMDELLSRLKVYSLNEL